ncbi:MAG: hypothetical protein FJ138_09370 [Deltaproteobacteria bacterium]|nr:hypothetical protein [Deltaproteobacteria bacterium]
MPHPAPPPRPRALAAPLAALLALSACEGVAPAPPAPPAPPAGWYALEVNGGPRTYHKRAAPLARLAAAGCALGEVHEGSALRVALSGEGCAVRAERLSLREQLALGAPIPAGALPAHELTALKGVGERLAARLVAAGVDWSDPAALRAVKGVGPKLSARLAARFSFAPPRVIWRAAEGAGGAP